MALVCGAATAPRPTERRGRERKTALLCTARKKAVPFFKPNACFHFYVGHQII